MPAKRTAPSRGSTSTAAAAAGKARDARSVFDSIRRIVRVLRLGARHTEKAFGLSAAQLFVLQKLAEADALTPSDLAEKALTDQSSISVVVQRLVDRGYVARARSAADARSYDLSLTDAGRTVVRNSPDATQDRLLAAMREMPAANVRQLARLLEELVSHTGLSTERPTMLMEDDGPAVPSPRRR